MHRASPTLWFQLHHGVRMAQQSQQIFESVVKPLMQAAVDAAGHGGMKAVAVVEHAPGAVTSFTGVLRAEEASAAFYLVDCAARARGDVDQLLRALMLHASTVGHDSVLLEQLGVPRVPVGAAVGQLGRAGWLGGMQEQAEQDQEVQRAIEELAVVVGDPIMAPSFPRTRESELIRTAAEALRASGKALGGRTDG